MHGNGVWRCLVYRLEMRLSFDAWPRAAGLLRALADYSYTIILLHYGHYFLLLAGGDHACGCHSSLGPPLGLLHGSCPYFFATPSPGCSEGCALASLLTLVVSGATGCVLAVSRVGRRWPFGWPGASMTLGLASHRASACAARIFMRSWRTSSCDCSVMEGGCSRV